MRLILQAIAVICITTQVYGDERLVLESRAAAHESLRILGSGDRQGAIRLVLQALPEDPTSSDLALHPEAMEALWRVVAARIVVLEDDGRVLAATSPNGTRMLI